MIDVLVDFFHELEVTKACILMPSGKKFQDAALPNFHKQVLE